MSGAAGANCPLTALACIFLPWGHASDKILDGDMISGNKIMDYW